MAKKEHLKILKQGVEVWNIWRKNNPDVKPDLRKTDLSGARLSLADLSVADLSGANLIRADLSGANLSGADLIGADLIGAYLIGANLSGADLIGAYLLYANLQKAKFRGATFSGVSLKGANLTEADLTAIHIDRETADQIPDALREKYEGSWVFLKDESVIEHSIEFPPGCHEAGMGILSYFGTIVRQKYKDTKIGVTIKQVGQKVTLIVETPEDEREKIEKTLEEYGLVVTGNMPPEEFLSNPIEVMELKQKLEITHTELKLRKELSEFKDKQYGERIGSLEKQIECLNKSIEVISKHSEKAMNHSEKAVQVLSDNAQFSREFIRLTEKHADIRNELEALHEKLNSTFELSETDIQVIKDILSSIEKKKPQLIQKIKSIAGQIVLGAGGSGLWTYIQGLL